MKKKNKLLGLKNEIRFVESLEPEKVYFVNELKRDCPNNIVSILLRDYMLDTICGSRFIEMYSNHFKCLEGTFRSSDFSKF